MLMWFCDEMIFSGKIPFFRDLVTYFYPIKFSVAEAFKAGSLPMWDQHMATGFPIMAEFQSAVFYPPTSPFICYRFLRPYSLSSFFITPLPRSVPTFCSDHGNLQFMLLLLEPSCLPLAARWFR